MEQACWITDNYGNHDFIRANLDKSPCMPGDRRGRPPYAPRSRTSRPLLGKEFTPIFSSPRPAYGGVLRQWRSTSPHEVQVRLHPQQPRLEPPRSCARASASIRSARHATLPTLETKQVPISISPANHGPPATRGRGARPHGGAKPPQALDKPASAPRADRLHRRAHDDFVTKARPSPIACSPAVPSIACISARTNADLRLTPIASSPRAVDVPLGKAPGADRQSRAPRTHTAS